MSKYYLFQDTKNCISCHACEIQCKTAKNLPVGPRLCQVVPVGPKFVGNTVKATYVFMSCFHCENPWCVASCPTGAMQKRPADGIVFIDHELCVGCKACIRSCPWGAPQWDPEAKKVVKCDYCKDRVDSGLNPACVTICTTGCLHFGPGEKLPDILRRRHAEKVAQSDEVRS